MINETGRVSFGRALKDFFRGYVDFLGRSTRAGYWWVQLVLIAAIIGWGSAMVWLLVSDILNGWHDVHWGPYVAALVALVVVALVLLVPTLTLEVRRYRDVGIRGRATAVLLGIRIVLSGIGGVDTYHTTVTTITQFHVKVGATPEAVSSGGLLCQSLSAALGLFLFVVSVLPSDAMVTTSQNKLLRFCFRQGDAPRT